MKCTACQKELSKKEVMFTEERNPYCANPFTCNDNHPNSVKNIVARGGAVDLYTEDELEVNLFDKLNVSDEMKERIEKVATKPQSIRLSKIEIAHYLLMLQDQKEFSSISEAVRYCVTRTMEAEPIEAQETKVEESPVFGQTRTGFNSTSGIKIVVGEEEKKPAPVEEDEFTF